MKQGVTRFFFILSFSVMTSFLFPLEIRATITASLESPLNGQEVSGIAIVRGWAFDTQAGSTINSVELFIDGVKLSNAPCCSARSDISVAFPQAPSTNTLNSGFGLTVNWGNLSAGSHTVRVDIKTTSGEVFSSDTRTIMVVKPGNFRFLSQFDTSDVFVDSQGQELILEDVQIRDKETGQSKRIDAHFVWREDCQCLVMVTEEDSPQ